MVPDTVKKDIDDIKNALTTGGMKTQLTDAGGEAVTVTGGKLDVNASVDTTGLALDATLTDASQKSQLVDGSGNVIGATSNALDVNIKSGASSGTQYTEGDTDASITGTAILWEDTSDTLRAVSAAKPLPVSVTGGGDASAANQTTIIGHVDGIEALLTTIDADTSKIPSQGQALAAASMPVVLPADQITTLTPPAAITGFATSAKQDTIDTSINTLLKPASTLAAVTSITNVVHVDDNGGALTVDGAVTANAGTNLNTSALALEAGGNLAAIKAKTDNIPALGQALAAASVPVILPAATITTLTPPAAITGFATSAKQDTIIGHVDGIETVLGTIDADTSNISTKIDTIAGAISATHMQVDVLTAPTTAVTGPLTDTQLRASAVPVSLASVPSHAVTNAGTFATQVTAISAGDNNIGNVDIASIAAGNNNIGDVDVASIAAGDNNIGNVDLASAIPAGTNAIGKLLPPDIDVTAHTNYARKYYTSAGAATDGIIWSPAAGKRWHITSLYIQVSADATVTLEDDKAGGDDPVLKGEFKAGSGVPLVFDKDYPLASGEDAADLIITTSAGNVYVTAVGYEI